jgi:non-specific serine/threonine protein kinase
MSGAGSENCLAIGTRLAEFEITGVIGEGGFGIVYLAFDHSLQRTVAIKEYMPAPLAARGTDHAVTVRAKRHEEAFAAGLRSFINEARLLAQFDHPALIKVYRFWEQNESAYMAMRYYEGETFKSVVAGQAERIDEAWLKRVLQQLLGALDALYQVNILHRDVSPENIIIQPNGQAVLLDFGAARQIVSGLAQSLTVILKPGFAPVEQYADDEAMEQGPWTDIYALSAVMYLAVAQKPPPSAVGRLLNDPIAPLADGDHPGFGKSFLAALDQGLAVRPENRPRSIAAFAALLDIDMAAAPAVHAAAAPPAAVAVGASAPAPATVSAASQRRRWPLVGGIAAVAVAAIGLGVTLSQGGNAPAAAAMAPVTVASAPALPSPMPMPASASASASASAGAAPASAPVSSASASAIGEKAAPPGDHASASASQAAQAPFDQLLNSPADAKPAGPTPTPAPVPPPKPKGALTLSVLPWGEVFIDGKSRGVSPPLKKLMLAPGAHHVRVVNPAFPACSAEVVIDAAHPAPVHCDFAAPVKP